MPSKQKDKHISLEEAAAFKVAVGRFKFLAGIMDWNDLTLDEQRKILRIKRNALELLQILDREDTPSEMKRKIEALFKRLGVRKPRKKADAGKPQDHKG